MNTFDIVLVITKDMRFVFMSSIQAIKNNLELLSTLGVSKHLIKNR